MVEMTYQFDLPFVLDTTHYESTFGTTGTPLHQAVVTTLAWYRDRRTAPADDAMTLPPVLSGPPETERKEQKP